MNLLILLLLILIVVLAIMISGEISYGGGGGEGGGGRHNRTDMQELYNQVVEIYTDLRGHYDVFAFLEQIRIDLVPRKGIMSDSDYLQYIRKAYTDLEMIQPDHALFTDQDFRMRLFAQQDFGMENSPVNLMPILHYPAIDYRDWREHAFPEPIPIGTFKIHLLEDRWILADLVNPQTGEFLSKEETKDWFMETYKKFASYIQASNKPSISSAVHISIIRKRHMIGPNGQLSNDEIQNFLNQYTGRLFTIYARGIATGFSFNFTKFDWFNALLIHDSVDSVDSWYSIGPTKSEFGLAQFEEALRDTYPATSQWITAPGKHHVTLACRMR